MTSGEENTSEPENVEFPAMREAMESGKPISVLHYSLEEGMESKLHRAIKDILDHYERPDLEDSVYSIVKELAINGNKANLKEFIFHQLEIDPHNPGDYERGMAEFRSRLNQHGFEVLGPKLRSEGYEVLIRLIQGASRLFVEVINNVPVPRPEDQRIRDKLRECMQYESLADFYLDHADDSEGAGIGFAMVIILLKGEHIDPHAFTLNTTRPGKTIARVEIPMEKPGRLLRHDWPAGKDGAPV